MCKNASEYWPSLHHPVHLECKKQLFLIKWACCRKAVGFFRIEKGTGNVVKNNKTHQPLFCPTEMPVKHQSIITVKTYAFKTKSSLHQMYMSLLEHATSWKNVEKTKKTQKGDMRGPAIWKAAPQQNRCKNRMKNNNTALSHQIRSPRAEQLKVIKTLITLTNYVPIGLRPLRQAALQGGLRNCKMYVTNNSFAHFVISSAVNFDRKRCVLQQKLNIALLAKWRIAVKNEWFFPN